MALLHKSSYGTCAVGQLAELELNLYEVKYLKYEEKSLSELYWVSTDGTVSISPTALHVLFGADWMALSW